MPEDTNNSVQPKSPTALEILTKFLEDNKIELAVEPPKFQFLPNGNFLIEKPVVQVQFKKDAQPIEQTKS